MKNYYSILGVDKNASDEDIAKAYRKLAIQYHPDKNPDDSSAVQRFKEITEAFETLGDPQKRRNYDAFGSGSHRNHGFGADPFGIFGDIFGDGFARQDHEIVAEIRCEVSLEEAYLGCRRTIDVPIIKVCPSCSGDGATSWVTCNVCNGRGRQVQTQGMFQVAFTCSRCRGGGRLPEKACDQCQGEGEIREGDDRMDIQIPPGVAAGFSLKFSTPPGSKAGFILCRIDVTSHPYYSRQNTELHGSIPLTISQLFDGAQVELPHPSGKSCVIKVPPCSKPGAVLRVPGMGMPALSRSNVLGDLFLRLELDWPKNPSAEYRDLVKSLAGLDDKEEYEGIENFRRQIAAAMPKQGA